MCLLHFFWKPAEYRHLDNMDTIVCPVHVPINRVPLYIESQLRKSQKSNSVNRVVLFL